MNTAGLHHITAIAGDPQANVDFYTGLLGLRLVKKTVNFDDPGTYHFYYGDELGNPGSVLTFFPWGRGAPRGRPGVGQAVAVSYAVPSASRDYWIARLAGAGLEPSQEERFGSWVLGFQDPDGMAVELAGVENDGREGWGGGVIPAEHALRGFHAVSLLLEVSEGTSTVLEEYLGLSRLGEESGRHRFGPSRAPHTYVDIVLGEEAGGGRMGAGAVHHVAFRTADSESQQQLRKALLQTGLNVSEVRDRSYFESIYFVEPGGVLFEVATDGPGFTHDEPVSTLGTELKLPEWLESRRQAISRALLPVRFPQEARK